MTSHTNASEGEAQEQQQAEGVQSEENVADIKDARIKQLEEECVKLKENWLRSVAETDNIRKRSQRELEETRKYAISGFAGDMVSVLENLKRAVESIPEGAAAENAVLKTVGEGVGLTLQELLGIFGKYGITRIDPLGGKFDHNLHQAVAQVENNEVEAGTVIQVIQAGYMIADRLLRPAMVAVSKTSSAPDTKKLDTVA